MPDVSMDATRAGLRARSGSSVIAHSNAFQRIPNIHCAVGFVNKKTMTRYQTRVTKLVWGSNAYLIVVPIALLYFGSPLLGWPIYFSTATINFCLAAGLDAVFDSLSERMNIQSSWLDVRLGVVERAVGAESGQEAWKTEAVPTNDPAHYFSAYPEQMET